MSKRVMVDCYKCDATGTVEWAMHVMNGVCFMCKGTGKVWDVFPCPLARELSEMSHRDQGVQYAYYQGYGCYRWDTADGYCLYRVNDRGDWQLFDANVYGAWIPSTEEDVRSTLALRVTEKETV